MRYLIISLVLLAAACNTSSTEKGGETDSAKVDGTRLTDTLPPANDSGAAVGQE